MINHTSGEQIQTCSSCVFQQNKKITFFQAKIVNYYSCKATVPVYCIRHACLTHLSLGSLLWDIGKQNSPRCDAAERGVPPGAILFA